MLKRIITLLFVALITISAQAQNFGIDFENIRVDDLSNQQVMQLYERMQERGLTISEVESLAIARGMNPSEVSKLRSRINSVRSSMSGLNQESEASNQGRLRSGNASKSLTNRSQGLRPDTLDVLLDSKERDTSDVFGSDIFSSQSITFEPSLNIPTPKNYTLGPGDELFIDIWGAAEKTYQLVISPEGSIQISNVGPIVLNGLTIEEAKERLSSKLSTIYSGLKGSNKTTYMQVTLGDIRSIKVSIVGEVKAPGTYTLSSLSSVFNALYAAGGPNKDGSYRSIKVLRDGKVHQNVDLYKFLVSGDLSDNIILKDQDIIKVNPYVNRITVKGETKNVGLFETLEGETFNDLLEYAGGFNQFAYKKRVKLERKTDTEKRIVDIAYPENGNTVLRSGDIVTVGRILDRYENKVTIKGPVFRPGEYQLEENPTLSKLIENAEGLMGDAFMERAVIYRTQKDYSIEAIPVNLNHLMSDTSSSEITLVKDDVVQISSIFDLRELRTVKISGSVLNPDTYKYVENSSLKDLIYQANGFKEEAAPYNIEIARRIPDAGSGEMNNQIAEIITVNIENGLAFDDKLDEVELQPFDQVFVRKSPSYEVQQTVRVTGEVMYPGEYTISNRNFRLSDLIEKSGGPTDFAYVEGASLTRNYGQDIENLSINLEDSVTTQQVESLSQVGIQLQEALRNPNSEYDLLLQPGDVIEIPKRLQTVQIRGEVLYPINARYEDRRSFRSYISAAGGFTEQANTKKAYIVYANGEVDRTKKFLFFKSYPDVKPGSVLIIPPKEQRERLSAQERIAILSTIVSMAAIVTNTIFQIRRN
ncbi:MAG: SLBB domain-containing protein [Gracilimonas sp.]|uniref:SLBB domain-containing protein n=1 Tax=Gracilimonas TaxID=649462 RepID=UPI001B089381|nr:SLBB domain-containing protein [Gracilimonas sp.]MBO6587215.1 SLBB domain-containing protein [Gracilimonas sp.]MBO6614297.1 SLBB domain-containing protein [Gracilimonas sp.]